MHPTKIASGRIQHIHEVLTDESLQQTSVRITGILVAYDAAANCARIEYNGQGITINTELLHPFDHQIGSLFQFIGETYASQGQIMLRARIARNVDGLDMTLFDQALAQRRRFLSVTMAA